MTLRALVFMLCFTVGVDTRAAPPEDATAERFEFTQLLMGVEARVTLYAEDEERAREAAAAAFGRIAELDAALSDYRPDSELMRLCDRAGSGPVAVGDDLFKVLRRATEVSEASGGAFDVTVGPVVGLWREARRSGRLPEASELHEAMGRVGWKFVRLDERARTVDLRRPRMRLDLGGIAKGYATQEAVAVLKEREAGRCLVSLAGDVAAGDPPPGEDGWTVALEIGGETRVIPLANAAVSTSGDTEQFVEVGGVRYSHVVDPRTGVGVVTRARATVVAEDGMTADALASALTVVGVDGAAALLARFPDAAAYVEAGGETGANEKPVRLLSDNFPPLGG